jgi:hypothetical protein
LSVTYELRTSDEEKTCPKCAEQIKAAALKRFPPDLNRRDSQRVRSERIWVH